MAQMHSWHNVVDPENWSWKLFTGTHCLFSLCDFAPTTANAATSSQAAPYAAPCALPLKLLDGRQSPEQEKISLLNITTCSTPVSALCRDVQTLSSGGMGTAYKNNV
jgi:hypothetical protein